MEFFAHNGIEAPIDFVFARVTDFTSFERSIIRRGGDVERLSVGDVPVVGSKWRVKFRWRGKVRTLDAELTTVDAPNGIRADASSKNIVAAVTVELVALSRARTRISVRMDVTAKNACRENGIPVHAPRPPAHNRAVQGHGSGFRRRRGSALPQLKGNVASVGSALSLIS